MEIQTGNIIELTLTLTEPEARTFLFDPEPLQNAIRDALAAPHRNGHNGATATTKSSRSRKAVAKPPFAGKRKPKSISTPYECEHCGKGFLSKGWYVKHLQDYHDEGGQPALAADS